MDGMGVNMSNMKEIARIEPACCPIVLGAFGRHEAEQLAVAMPGVPLAGRHQLASLTGLQPGDEACAGDLIASLGLSQPTVTHHLTVLHDAGLVERGQRGRRAFYRLRPEGMRHLSKALFGPAST